MKANYSIMKIMLLSATCMVAVNAKGEPAVVYLAGEKFILDPLPSEMRTRVHLGTKHEVIPGSVGLGYIVEGLNDRMTTAMKKGAISRCQQLQELCHIIDKQRQQVEKSDIKLYGEKIKEIQETPLVCSAIIIESQSRGHQPISNVFWLIAGAGTAFALCYCAYKCRIYTGARTTKFKHRPSTISAKKGVKAIK